MGVSPVACTKMYIKSSIYRKLRYKSLSFFLPSPNKRAYHTAVPRHHEHATYKPKRKNQRRDGNSSKKHITARLLMPLPTPHSPPALTHLMNLKVLRSPRIIYKGALPLPSSSPASPEPGTSVLDWGPGADYLPQLLSPQETRNKDPLCQRSGGKKRSYIGAGSLPRGRQQAPPIEKGEAVKYGAKDAE